MSELASLTIAEASRRLAKGTLRSIDLVDACLARIERHDAKLNAFTTLTPELARAASRQADRELSAGHRRGALHGIPVGIKDIYETAGVRTAAHSHLKIDHVPTVDAETVARLRAAGAVILGKLTTHEFATGAATPDQPFPPARNPWNPELQPGGSSSGSGAALAAAFCLGAMGSDTSGSIRNPAGWCAVSGLKPTYGLLSRRGIFPLAPSFDTAGPMAWTAEDCGLMMDVLAGHDPLDPASADVAAVSYGEIAARATVAGLRIGWVRHWYAHADDASEDMVRAIDEAADVMRALGATVEEVTMPDLLDYQACARVIISAECHALYRKEVDRHPEKFGYTTRRRLQLGAFLTAEQYVNATRFRRKLQLDTDAAMRGFDLLMTANHYGPLDRFENPPVFHFLAKPPLPNPFNVTGQPALSVCCGFGRDGSPLAFQFAGRAFDDATVLAAGTAYERATPWRNTRPAL
ncbi:MAG: amidase [Alphaproteobacteria bacterium]|nr:amidase [Alphaproteobacteria bacterium]